MYSQDAQLNADEIPARFNLLSFYMFRDTGMLCLLSNDDDDEGWHAFLVNADGA